MNSAILMAMLYRGQMSAEQLRQMTERQTERRVKLFSKVVELLFAFVMLFFGDLSISVTKDGKSFDPSDPSLSVTDKLNALLVGLKTSDRGTRWREFLRPLLMEAAEFIAKMMAPDETTLALLSSGVLNGISPLAQGQPVQVYSAPAAGSGLPVAPVPTMQGEPGNPNFPIKVPPKAGGSY